MIFVTVGSSTIPFDRLLQAIDTVSIDERLLVQHGTSTIRPQRADCIEFLEYDEFVELVREARIVVTHAGVGSIMTAVEACIRPIVIPRRGSYGEAVDDHQVAFARRAAKLGLVTLVEDVDSLAAAIADYASGGVALTAGRSPIEVELRAYIEECIGPRAPLVIKEGSTA